MSTISQTTALVTGGAQGIGNMMANRFLKEGARRIIIWDINETLLNQVVSKWNDQGYEAYGYVVNVTDPVQVKEAAEDILEEIGSVTLLVNNAGIVVGKDFEDHSQQDIALTMGVNTLGPMYVTQAFLPAMIRKGKGHIVNIASASGFTPVPGMSVYAASKWAVIGWSESLRLELEKAYDRLHVMTVCPSYINTGMFEGVDAPLLTRMLEPEEIVDKIIQGIKDNEVMLKEPFMVRVLPAFRGVLPERVYDFVVGDVFKVYESMKNFTGHPKKGVS
ncbi:MAG: SDR family oxidoreductase [Bacteroidota bacterium]